MLLALAFRLLLGPLAALASLVPLLGGVARFGVLLAAIALAGVLGWAPMRIEFSGTIWFWRGPAPFFFVTAPEEDSRELKAVSGAVTYGWGMIPVRAQIGATAWKTALFPKDDRYLVPLKDAVRKAEGLGEGDEVHVVLEVW